MKADAEAAIERAEEESEARAELQRQVSKLNADVQMWRGKYEQEGLLKLDEVEDARCVHVALE